MNNTVSLPLEHFDLSGLDYGRHDVFGDYIYDRRYKYWQSSRGFDDGNTLNIRSRSSPAPNEGDVELWLGIDRRIFDLIEEARTSIVDPQLNTRASKFSAAALWLVTVELNAPDCFSLRFSDVEFCERVVLWPIVSFTNFEVTDSEWEP